jgi:hypothetical protein
MIWSVNNIIYCITTTREWIVLKRFPESHLICYTTACGVGNHTGDCRGSRGQRAGQEGASTLTLASFKVTVAGGDRVLAGFDLIAVHGDTHTAAWFAPFGTGFFEDDIQFLHFRLTFDILEP